MSFFFDPNAASLGPASTIGVRVVVVTLFLIAMLIVKEIGAGVEGTPARRFARALNVALVPIVLVVVLNAAFMVADVLR